MRRRFAFPEKLRLGLIFGLMATIGFLAFKNMNSSSAINSAYNGFSAGNIISDYVMSDYASMSEAEIQAFLKSKNPCNDTNIVKASWYPNLSYHIENGHFVCMADERFNGESAAHIIWQAAQDYRINPKVLIVLLEKEQGLVTDTWPNSTLQYRSATGYGCPDTAACDSQYYGFKNQVRNSAELFRYILDNGSRYYPVGNNFVKYNPDGNCGGSTVNIENRATSALYQYTPYQPNASVLNSNPGTVVHCGAYGNSNFYFYYTRWFGDTHTTLNSIYVSEYDSYALKTANGFSLATDANESGAKLVLTKSATDASQNIRFERDGYFYRIRHISTGLLLGAENSATDNGNSIQLVEGDGTCRQKWLLTLNGDGSYTIRSACSWKAIDIPNARSTEGAILQMYDNNNTSAQKFILSDRTTPPVNSDTYIISTVGGKSLDIVDGKTSNGTRLHTYYRTYLSNQQYSFVRNEDGFYTIKNVASGKAVDVAGASESDGASIQLYDSNGTCAQKWNVEIYGAGYRFKSACSGKVMDVPGGNYGSNFYKIQLYTANDTNAQIWKLLSTKTVADGEYTIKSLVGGDFALDISNGVDVARDGTNIQIYATNNTEAQKFKITYKDDKKSYVVSNAKTKRVLDVSNAGKTDGTNIQIWNYDTRTCAQHWYIRVNDDNTYTFISSCSDKVLDVSGASARNSTNVQIWSDNGTKAQKWALIRQ